MPKPQLNLALVYPPEVEVILRKKKQRCVFLQDMELYFRVGDDDDVDDGGWQDTANTHTVRLTLYYFDTGTETVTITYTTDGTSETTETLFTKTDTGIWKRKHKKLASAVRFNHSLYPDENYADFYITSPDGELYLGEIIVKDTVTKVAAVWEPTLDPRASVIEWESDDYQAGLAGWRVGGDDDNAEFQDVLIRGELRAAAFVKDLVSAHAGTLLVAKSAGKLDAKMTVPGSGTWVMTIKDPPSTGWLFDNTDIGYCRETQGSVTELWFTVVRLAQSGGQQTYTCTYASGTRPNVFQKGVVITDYGQSGQGWLELSADRTNAPYYDIYTHAGAPWTTTTRKGRFGNLTGINDPTFGALSGYGIWTDNGYFTGSISAGTGAIGGFNIGADYVRDVANSFGLASTVTGGDDVRFWAGAAFASRATAPFRVTEAGVVTASNITITGGAIAGWTIGADYIRSAADTVGMASTVTAGDDVRFWAGASFANRATAPFRVTEAGVLTSTSALIGGWTIDADEIKKTGIILDSTADAIYVGSAAPRILIDGATKSIKSTNYTAGLDGWFLGGANDFAEFENILARGELRASVFKISEMSATAGTFGVWYSAGTLYSDCTTAASADGTAPYTDAGAEFTLEAKNSDAGGMLFAVGDFLRLKSWTGAAISNSWAYVKSRADHTSYATYTCTLTSGSTNAAFKAGTAVVDYGPSGTGFITLSADGTIGSTPNLSMATHAGVPWTTVTPIARLGNLNGTLDYATDVYGFVFGDLSTPTASTRFVAYDPTNGLRIQGNVTIGGGGNANYGVDIGEALLLCRYDGPRPYETDFTGDFTGHKGQAPSTQTGGLIFRPGKFGKGIQLASGTTTNLVPNPSFETNTTGWGTYGTGPAIAQSSAYAYYGSYALELTVSSNDSGAVSSAITVTSGQTYTASAWVTAPVGETVGIQVYDGAAYYIESTTGLGLGTWIRLTQTVTMSGTSLYVRLCSLDASSFVFYADGVQVENTAYATPYLDGSLGVGHAWTGTAHASTSTRTATRLEYTNTANSLARPDVGTVSFWFTPNSSDWWTTAGASALSPYFFRIGGNHNAAQTIVLWHATASETLRLALNGADICTYSDNALAAGAHHLAATWTGTTATLYVDGVAVSTNTFTAFAAFAATLLEIGALGGTSRWLNGVVDDLAVLPVALSAAEIYAIYASNTPLRASSSVFNLILKQPDTDPASPKGYILGNANGLFGYSSSSGAADTGVWALVTTASTALGVPFGSPTLDAGDILIGSASASHGNLFYDASASTLYWRVATTNKISIDTSGNILVGQTGASQNNVYLASGGVQLRTNTTVKIDLQADGDAFFGSDISAAASTALAIFTNAQTYDGFAVGAGDVLIGAPSSLAFWFDISEGELNLITGTDNVVTVGSGSDNRFTIDNPAATAYYTLVLKHTGSGSTGNSKQQYYYPGSGDPSVWSIAVSDHNNANTKTMTLGSDAHLTIPGSIFMNATKGVYIGGTQIVGDQQTGWGAWSGTASRSGQNADTCSLADVAAAMHALLDDLTAHGLIGG